ncbi:hypothetical protein FKM82_025552 [Ascaphus truei]
MNTSTLVYEDAWTIFQVTTRLLYPSVNSIHQVQAFTLMYEESLSLIQEPTHRLNRSIRSIRQLHYTVTLLEGTTNILYPCLNTSHHQQHYALVGKDAPIHLKENTHQLNACTTVKGRDLGDALNQKKYVKKEEKISKGQMTPRNCCVADYEMKIEVLAPISSGNQRSETFREKKKMSKFSRLIHAVSKWFRRTRETGASPPSYSASSSSSSPTSSSSFQMGNQNRWKRYKRRCFCDAAVGAATAFFNCK